ncbi:MAG: glucose 1-dehydrogenase [Planctomycetota bacterium]
MNLFNLTGKVAIVTGGSSGIGFGISKGLGQAGAIIAIASRDQAKAADAVKQLSDAGVECYALACDVTSETDVRAMVKTVYDKHGKLNILVNNAGTNIRRRPEVMTHAEWRQVLDTNLDSAFHCSAASHPFLKQSGGGKIITIGSMLSIFGSPWAPAYAASKGAIVQLTKSLATSWAVDNIQVNCLLPGWIDTPLTRKAREEIPGLNEKVLARTPAGRWGSGDDFAGVSVFLSSAASDFITGSSITVDGGFSISML